MILSHSYSFHKSSYHKLCLKKKKKAYLYSAGIQHSCIVPNGISPMGNSGCFLRGKPAATESRHPTNRACWVLQRFHNPPNSDMDHRIFNVRTDVNARDCTRGCADTVRESALKVDSGKKIPCRNGESNQRQRRDGPMLNQPSYTPPTPRPS